MAVTCSASGRRRPRTGRGARTACLPGPSGGAGRSSPRCPSPPDDDGLVLVAGLALWIVLLACVTGPVLLRRAVGSPDDVPESELRTSDLVEHRRAHRSAHRLVLRGTVVLALLATADRLDAGRRITATGWIVIMIGAAVSGSMLPSAVAAWQWTDPTPGDLTPGTDEQRS